MHIQREWVTPVAAAGALLRKQMQMQVLGALFAEAK